MQKHFSKFRKVFKSITFFPLIFVSNNSLVFAKDLPNDTDKLHTTLEIRNINKGFSQDPDINNENLFIAENTKDIDQENVLISEIIILTQA